ncbi:MAG: hypothetical protein IKZ96_02015 [Bacilli bacterium]|nr:hypothetical protein [Bacilli bacterium]
MCKQCINSFNEAIKERVKLNDELLKSFTSKCKSKDDECYVRENFFNRLNIIRELENKIETSTKDINPCEKKDELVLEEFEGFNKTYEYNSEDIKITNMFDFKTSLVGNTV